MAGFNFGAFAGGVGSGIEQGQNIRERYKKLSDENVARRAQQDVDNWLQGGGQGPNPALKIPGASPGAPGMTAPPANLGGLQPVAMPGAQPMPQPGGAPPPGGPPGPPPPAPGMQPQPGSPAPLGASPPPVAPPIPGSAGGGGAPPPQPGGGAPSPNPQAGDGAPPDPSAAPSLQQQTQEAKTALQAVARQIAQANPGRHWQPGELLDAVDNVIGQMDKLNPQAKILAQAQIAGAKAQHDYYLQAMKNEQSGANVAARDATSTANTAARDSTSTANTAARDSTSTANTDTRVAATERGQDLAHEDRGSALAERIRHEKATEQTAQTRAATYAEMATLSHEDRVAAIQAANDRATQAVDSRERMAAQHEAAAMARLDEALEQKNYALAQSIIAGEYKAQAGNAPVGAAPKPPPVGAPPARRPGGGAPVAAPAASAQPPVAGARKAPDGNWYVSDPQRPGKYLKVG